ncbi:hypothetical protein [Paenibacillus sp. YN15]|uniref:hypothetical protein n=1 Tax=Paenibacillus sp. YN15 TaxID=1742774 RepID=UPI000DCDC56E|nr:hypothetical protein [Paenibacillus sp. YN15]RAV05528.1 hypothetical protein DQG13_02595 [Paenibacillus sp. YN15]
MAYIKPVICDPYYDCPVWIENEITRNENTFLSQNSSTHDVELFLLHLFGFGRIAPGKSFTESFEELLSKDEVAISGGIAFFKDETTLIGPSCCCGLEQWREVEASILNKKSPWLGHDPFPSITYEDDRILVWPDDPSKVKDETFSIPFTYEEMLDGLGCVQQDLIDFIEGPLMRWIMQRDEKLALQMKQKMFHWFIMKK